MDEAIEFVKSVPVVADVDVLIAGGGIAGCTAAVTAARNGAQTMVVDRYGCLGGNMGPGMFSGGRPLSAFGYPKSMPNGLTGIPGEFERRCEAYLDEPIMYHYSRDSQVVSYVWSKMMQEDGVQLMLNTFVADPIMEGNRVTGLTMENKSGTQAVRAKVVIDATGDADVATRAGAPVDDGQGFFHPGMYFTIANVDQERYLAFLDEVGEPDPDNLAWAKELFLKTHGSFVSRLNPLIKFYRQAWELGEYAIVGKIDGLATVTVDHGLYQPRQGIIGAQIGLRAKRKGLSGDAAVMSRLEAGSRMYIFGTAQFLRRHVPGFERSYLHRIAPYFHSRGGRSAISERPLTVEDYEEDLLLGDVIYEGSDPNRGPSRFDFPYRQLLPREVEGLLMAGRSAIVQPPRMRTRWKVLLMGQAAGLAAALAATGSVTPREVDVKKLQRLLYRKYQAPLGDEARLKELGII